MISKRLIRISFPFILLVGVYFLGPEPAKPVFDPVLPIVPVEATELENYIARSEAKHTLKPDNEARIIWADSTKQKTEYAVVYLHGFSASQMEGDPTHRKFAEGFGCNLYLARLSDHGIDTTETLLYFTADRFWESAKQALSIGKQLGNKVILLSTSTGGTAALKLAGDYPEDVFALINLSPNIELRNGAAFLLNDPWGLQIARAVKGGNYNITGPLEGEHAKYWNRKYRLEALTQLEEFEETTMTRTTFKKVKQPSLTLYYYKSEAEQDDQVKVSAILQMHEQLGTAPDMKEAIAMPNTGAHVIGGSLSSHDVEGVLAAIEKFAIEKLNMPKK